MTNFLLDLDSKLTFLTLLLSGPTVFEMDNIKFKTEEGEFSKRIRPLKGGGRWREAPDRGVP